MSGGVAASVHQRLLNLSRKQGRSFQDLLQHYALERWLYRLSRSRHADRLVLKGALMLVAWQLPIARPTRDIDLRAHAENDAERIQAMIREICEIAVTEDGIVFDPASIGMTRIAADARYEGLRATFHGRLGRARVPMQIDLGFGDVITPGPVELTYPTVLDYPAPHLRAYNRETAIAEKFQAMVRLGDLNSRVKDFFDIWALATSQEFEGRALLAAMVQTFAQRGTAMTKDAACFEGSFGHSETKQAQWRAFIKRSHLTSHAPILFAETWATVVGFLRPMTEEGAAGLRWPRGGPWVPQRR